MQRIVVASYQRQIITCYSNTSQSVLEQRNVKVSFQIIIKKEGAKVYSEFTTIDCLFL